jgi:Iron-containing alcohol dehydrogenase
VVLGGSSRGCKALTEGLSEAGVRSVVFNVRGEPTTHLVDQANRIARADGCDLVISVGGGSVIDAGKAVAGMLANPGEVRDYLELAGGGKPLLKCGVPFIAVPTTAGTGTEVTRNAVLEVSEQKVKVSLRSSPREALRPRTARHPRSIDLSLSGERLAPLIEWKNLEVAVLDAAVAAITHLMDRNDAPAVRSPSPSQAWQIVFC